MKTSKLIYRGKNPNGDPYFIYGEAYEVKLMDIELDDLMLKLGCTFMTGFKIQTSKKFTENGRCISKTLTYDSLDEFMYDWRLPGAPVQLNTKGVQNETQ